MPKSPNGKTTTVKSKEEDVEGKNSRRQMGLLNAVATTVCSVIGSGIFIAPTGIISHVGSIGLSLFIWVVSGIIAVLGAFSYAELACAFPSSGGVYTFIHEAFGPLPAFITIWINVVLMMPAAFVVLALAASKYALQPFFTDGTPIPPIATRLLSLVIIGLLTFINCCDLRKTKKLLNAFMYFKLAALGSIIVGGFYAISMAKTDGFCDIWVGSSYDAGSIVLATYSGQQAFTGWESMVYMMEELKNPYKNLPKGILISLTIIIILYLMANAAYFAVLTPAQVLSSPAVAMTFVNALWGGVGVIVPAMVALSIFGSMTVRVLRSSRLCFAGARRGHLPQFMSMISISNKLPTPAIIMLALMSLLYLYFDDLYVLIELVGYVTGFERLLVIASAFYFRLKLPNNRRSFQVPLIFHIIFFIVTLATCIIPIAKAPVKSALGICAVLSAVPVYFAFIVPNQFVWSCSQRLSGRVTVIVQKLLLAGKEE